MLERDLAAAQEELARVQGAVTAWQSVSVEWQERAERAEAERDAWEKRAGQYMDERDAAYAQGVAHERERAARVCEDNDEVTNTKTNERFIQPKVCGNVNGLAYAAAIRRGD